MESHKSHVPNHQPVMIIDIVWSFHQQLPCSFKSSHRTIQSSQPIDMWGAMSKCFCTTSQKKSGWLVSLQIYHILWLIYFNIFHMIPMTHASTAYDPPARFKAALGQSPGEDEVHGKPWGAPLIEARAPGWAIGIHHLMAGRAVSNGGSGDPQNVWWYNGKSY